VRLDELLAGLGDEPDRVVVHAGDREWTLGDLDAHADALAAVLHQGGLRPGDPVAVLLPNGGDLIAALFGVWRAGGVYVPVNPRLTRTEIERVAERLRPAMGVTVAADADRVPEAAGVVVLDADAWRLERDADPDAGRLGTDVALVQFTSGTTGPPEPVPLVHDNVVALMDGVITKLGASSRAPDKAPMPNLIPVSLSLWAGIYNVLFAFRVGAAVVVMERFEPRAFVELVRRFAIRSTVLPPAAMSMLADDEGVEDLAPLRYVRSITAPLSPTEARRFVGRFGVSLLNSYGQTELGGEIVGWNAADSRAFGSAKLGSVGRPHDGVRIRILDGAGAEVPAGEAGEICVRTRTLDDAGPSPELAGRLTADGWFRTGDLGWVDAEGFVWIEGRVSDMINRGGLKVAPGEVEEVVRTVPGVVDVAVVGVPDARLGEVPWAFVVLGGGDEGGAPPSLDGVAGAIDERCRRDLAPYKVPARVVAVEALPRNEIGKILRRDLVARGVATHEAPR
jgi:acyl-CoA synthetase (AMP-forming)/AMP-acid ligase II